MSLQKRKVSFCSDYSGAKTGFGGFMREILFYLYKTNKYEISLFAQGARWEEPDFQRFPWKIRGTLPNNPVELNALNQDQNQMRAANYGAYYIDRFLQEEKPDALFLCQDPWSFTGWNQRKWWNKLPCVIHTTLDSLPILDLAIEQAKVTPYFYSWADFATKAMHKLGLTHVKTLRGSVNTNVLRRLPDSKRREIRERNNIPLDAFCIGMLSRNQLRKSFPNLLEGYKEFKAKNPSVPTRLFIHTQFTESWNIPKLIQEKNINSDEVIATYKCRATGRYYLLPYSGEEIDNPENPNIKKSLVTVNTRDGLNDEQLNEWYNVLDVYCHAFTSGGQERGIQEAKLAELITLVTNYSCGEDNCEEGSYSLPLDWEEYRDPHQSQFIKATTKPYSIAKQLEKVYKMDDAKRREWGKKAREWVFKNFSIEVIGRQFEEIIDNLPITNYDFDFSEPLKNPDAVVPQIYDNKEWIKALYKLILNRDVEDDDQGVQDWQKTLSSGGTRQGVEAYFRKVAAEENMRNQGAQNPFGPEPPEDRVLITMPESLGDCLHLTSLLKDARELYHDKKIYIATKPNFFDVFTPLVGELIDYVIPFNPAFDNVYALEGYAGNQKHFEVILSAHFPTQRNVSYIHNSSDKSKLNLSYR